MSNQRSRRDFIKGTTVAALTAGLPSAAHATLPFEEYAKYDGLGLAELVKKREVKPEELLEAAIARAEVQLAGQLEQAAPWKDKRPVI